MDIVTLDFETYYDKDYSLRKMTTEAYIRDPRFEVIGVAIKVNNHPTDWYSGSNVGKFLNSLDYSDKAILCHNTAFDGAILSWHYGINPKLWLDTLSMAKPYHNITVGGSLKALAAHYQLGAKGTEVLDAIGKHRVDFTAQELSAYGGYCINDVELTYALFKKLSKQIPVSELIVIDQTIRMYTEPSIKLDVPLLEQHLIEVRQAKEDLLLSSGMAIADIMSNDKFAYALKQLGVEPPTKTSARTGKLAWAFAKTDKDLTELLDHPDEKVQALVATRLGVKSTLEETRTESLIGVAQRGLLPIMLNYYGAHTGRFSGGDKLNLQNLPSRGGNNTIRRALTAGEGNVVISCDSSQIEARLVAYVAEQEDLLQAFSDKRDVYCEFATEVYGRVITKADKIERFVGKTAVLSLGYGAGAAKFREMLRIQNNVVIDEEEAQRIVNLYRQRNHKIVSLWRKSDRALNAMLNGNSYEVHHTVRCDKGVMTLPNGMSLHYPMLRKTTTGYEYIGKSTEYRKLAKQADTTWTNIYGGKVVENCIAADTEVLTDRGWVCIQDIMIYDMVHDGIEFVRHSGIIYKSVQDCVIIDGVYMTPDHEVLTNEGWQTASQNPEPYRPKIWGVNYAEPRTQRWEEAKMEIPVPMREAVREGWRGSTKGNTQRGHTELRVHDQATNKQSQQNPRYEQAPCVRSVAQYVRQMQVAYTSSVEKLRWSWDNSMQRVAGIFHEFLEGYGNHISKRFGLRPYRQQHGVLPRKLQVGVEKGEQYEQAQLYSSKHTRDEQTDCDTTVNTLLPTASRPVFDIINAGPRQRFVVRGTSGLFVVHNCVQALAALFIREQMVECGKYYKVALQVHDEIVIVVPEDKAQAAQQHVEQIMSTPPEWALDLPVACESGVAYNYGDT
jgi:DNA polymerase